MLDWRVLYFKTGKKSIYFGSRAGWADMPKCLKISSPSYACPVIDCDISIWMLRVNADKIEGRPNFDCTVDLL